MKDILQPAITLSREGYPVHEFSAYLQSHYEGALKKTAYSFGEDMLQDGKSPKQGDVVKNPKFADVLEVRKITITILCCATRYQFACENN